jgi:hypothetical protein
MKIFYIFGILINMISSNANFLQFLEDAILGSTGLVFKELNHEVPINLTITDHTINALLGLTNDMLKPNMTLYNEKGSPIPLDTNGLSILIPELANYKDNTNMSLFIYRDPKKHKQISIETTAASYLALAIGIKFNVFDLVKKDYVAIIDMSLELSIDFQVSPENNMVNVYINDIALDSVEVHSDSLGIDKDVFKNNFNMVIEIARPQLMEKTKFDIVKLIKTQSGAVYKDLYLYQTPGEIFFGLK